MKKCLIIICMILPLSLYAEETPVLISQYKNIEAHITKILNPVISEVLSNHTEPIGCTYVLGDTTCKGHDNFYYSQHGIHTPLDVYCAKRADCCGTNRQPNKQRNREQYCDCLANTLREESYDWEEINGTSILGLNFKHHFSSDGSCDKYSDVLIDSDEVYDSFFYECKRKNSDVKFCDKLAQTTQSLISTELRKQAVNKAKKKYDDMLQVSLMVSITPSQLYESEYKKIIDSKEFLSLFEGKNIQ